MKTYRLSEALEPNRNSFNLLRLLATLSVVWGHQALHFGNRSHTDYGALLFQVEYEGSLSVYTFFLISGLFISKSFSSNSSVLSFITLRVARVWPAAVVCSIGYLLIIGPLMSGKHRVYFLTEPTTWRCLWQNVTIVGGTCWDHPMAFLHAQVPMAWNNPLWTLPLEVHCYLLVLILGVAGVFKKPAWVILACTVLFALFLWIARDPPEGTFLANDFAKLGGYSFYPIPFFLTGMVLFAYRHRIVLIPRIAWSLCALYVATAHTGFGHALLYPTLVYGVLTFGASGRVREFWSPRNDYSYGIYIYGFVVGQFVSDRFQGIDGYLGIGIVYALTLPIAALSWHLVEQPALRFAHRAVRGTPPLDIRMYEVYAKHRAAVWSGLMAIIVALVGWRAYAEADHRRRLSLLDGVPNVPPSLIKAPEGLFAHAPSRFSIPVAGKVRLQIRFGIRDGAWREGTTNGVCFGVLEGANTLWRRCLDPKSVPADRGEHSASINLPNTATDVILETTCKVDCAYAWSYWSAATVK